MTVRNIKKSLVSMEDVAQGIGEVSQTRAGSATTVHKIDVPFAVGSEAEMSALDITKYTRARVYSSVATHIDYVYDPVSTVGIESDNGPGRWIESVSENTSFVQDSRHVLSARTMTAALQNDKAAAGYSVNVKEGSTGNGGQAMWDYVSKGTTPFIDSPNGEDIRQCTGVPSLVLKRRIRNQGNDLPILLVIMGQSNGAGSNSGGPNPGNPNVNVFDGATLDWGSSDYTATPMSRSTPNGNGGNNNIALALAHRLQDETGRKVHVVYDAVGGTSITEWVDSGTSSARYNAIKSKVEAALSSPELARITTVDAVIWQQCEEDALTMDFSTYLAKYSTLNDQLRAESWMADTTPILVGSPSALHERYAPKHALIHYCNRVDARNLWVNSYGLETSDVTHYTGQSLWDMGYTRMYEAFTSSVKREEYTPSLFLSRGAGTADRSDRTVVTTFSSIVSWDSKTSEYPVNSNAATGSISFGHACNADGNYSYALGYLCNTDNLCNYTGVIGRDLTANESADYSLGSGFQNALEAPYTTVSGRGNTVADSGGNARGTFCAYSTAEADPVIDQVGIGTSTGNRKNGFAVRKSGIVEMPELPVYADDLAAGSAGLSQGQLYITSTGEIRGKI